MNEKTFKLLKAALGGIVVFLTLILVMTYSRAEKPEKEFNLGKIRNNETSLVAYGNERFFFVNDLNDGSSNFQLINRNDETKIRNVIEEYKNLYVDSAIIAKENKLFYYAGENTNVYDIKENKAAQFAQGKLQYLTDEWYVTLYKGTLYKGIYYANTLKTQNINALTSDGDIKFAYEDEENLYYYATTSKGYCALLGLKKADLTITNYDTVVTREETFVEVSTNDEYIFIIIEFANNDLEYAIRTIPKNDKNEKWDVKLAKRESNDEKEMYSYVALEREDIEDSRAFDKNLYMLRFKVNESGEKLQDAYITFDVKSEKVEIKKPVLTDLCKHEYSAEIKGAALILYKNNKEFKKVTLSGYPEKEVDVTDIYKIDDDFYYKILIDSVQKKSIYIEVTKAGTAEIYQ